MSKTKQISIYRANAANHRAAAAAITGDSCESQRRRRGHEYAAYCSAQMARRLQAPPPMPIPSNGC